MFVRVSGGKERVESTRSMCVRKFLTGRQNPVAGLRSGHAERQLVLLFSEHTRHEWAVGFHRLGLGSLLWTVRSASVATFGKLELT